MSIRLKEFASLKSGKATKWPADGSDNLDSIAPQINRECEARFRICHLLVLPGVGFDSRTNPASPVRPIETSAC